MSQNSVECITGKIVLDARFREALLADPDQTLADFDLSESEKADVKRLDGETMELLAQTLADRIAKIFPAGQYAFIPLDNKQRD